MNRAIKYRLYPTEEQCIQFAKTFGCCRKVWNLMLSDCMEHYKEHQKPLYPTPAGYKKDYPYLREVDSLAPANVQLNLQNAYKRFFEDKCIGFPKFKSKKTARSSYTTNSVNGNITVLDGAIKLPKTGSVKAVIHRVAPDDWILKSVTISMEADGTYYASMLYEYHKPVHDPVHLETAAHIGLDYKSDGLYVDSNGVSCDMPHYYRRSEKKLAKLQQGLSRKQKGPSNRKKARIKVAKLSRHVANQRKDFLHKKSTEIANQYDVISVEDLNMKGMAQGLRLGKSTLDNGYGMFLDMLKYKQEERGHHLVRIGKFYASSQICSHCGYRNPATKDLSIRRITCPVCGHTYDRDHNAAINIDREGMRTLAV